MSQPPNQTNPAAQWWDDVGRDLKSVLLDIRKWAEEGSPKSPRAIGILEFETRVEGHIKFNGESYDINAGLAKVIADLAKSFTTPVFADLETEKPAGEVKTLGSTVAYDLACRVAEQNECAGVPIPECLQIFAPTSIDRPKRPRGRGEDVETRAFRDILAWWGVRHGVERGLKAERNRDDEIKFNRLDGLPSACELVTEAFHKAGWGEITYNMIVTAWQAHRYSGGKNQRKLAKKSNTAAYLSIFRHLDQLIKDHSSKKD